MIAMVFFDEETEEICRELGYNLILPSDELRRRLDSKIVTTQLGNEAGAPSVPNVLGTASTLRRSCNALATSNGLGTDLVVQTPYGDSGKTTFFIKSEADWDKDAEDIVGEQLKVMKRIDNKAAAVEACITRHGTIVGPFMTDLTGYPELTPYKGGWCGNDLFPEALTAEQRATAIEPRPHARRPARQGGLPGLPRDRRPRRPRDRRGLPRRAQPAHLRGVVDDQRHRRGLRRRARCSCSTCWSSWTSTTPSTSRRSTSAGASSPRSTSGRS